MDWKKCERKQRDERNENMIYWSEIARPPALSVKYSQTSQARDNKVDSIKTIISHT